MLDVLSRKKEAPDKEAEGHTCEGSHNYQLLPVPVLRLIYSMSNLLGLWLRAERSEIGKATTMYKEDINPARFHFKDKIQLE